MKSCLRETDDALLDHDLEHLAARRVRPQEHRRVTYRRLKGTEQFLGFYDVQYHHQRLGNTSHPLNRIRSNRPVKLEQH